MNTQMFRKGGSVRKHAANSVAGLITGAIVGTVVPMLQEWHADAQADKARAEFRADVQKQIDDFKAEQKQTNRSQWEAIGRKQDKY